MNSVSKFKPSGERAAALIIVLAFVVVLTAVSLAYLSRTTGDRPVAHSSFHQSKVDGVAASAMDIVIGDLQQEITNGSTATTQADGTTLYTPTAAANMVPKRSGTVAGVPNLIRRSVRSDPIPAPGVGSRASAVNSSAAADVSLNGRSVTPASWNRHYLVPKKNTGTKDSIPIDAFANATPDWVYITSTGIAPITQPSNSVVGRYAYAVYDEGGLLDMNVAGYPSGTTSSQAGRKGSVAFADLTALGSYPFSNPNASGVYQIDQLVGWRNYATTQASNLFPNTSFASNLNTSGPATLFVNYVTNNTDGFLGTSLPWWQVQTNNTNDMRTDQRFVQRQQLLAFQNTPNTNNGNPIANTSQFDVNALQYLGTFSREINSPSFSPSTPTATNPNFLLTRVTNSFTRFDGTTATVGQPLVKTRFPLSRLAWITYAGPSATRTLPPQSPALATTDPNYDMWALQWIYGVPASFLQQGTAANIKKCFGLTYNPP